MQLRRILQQSAGQQNRQAALEPTSPSRWYQLSGPGENMNLCHPLKHGPLTCGSGNPCALIHSVSLDRFELLLPLESEVGTPGREAGRSVGCQLSGLVCRPSSSEIQKEAPLPPTDVLKWAGSARCPSDSAWPVPVQTEPAPVLFKLNPSLTIQGHAVAVRTHIRDLDVGHHHRGVVNTSAAGGLFR